MPNMQAALTLDDTNNEAMTYFNRCTVCDKPFEITQLALFGDAEDIMVNECCEECWQWFRMLEFVHAVNHGRPFFEV